MANIWLYGKQGVENDKVSFMIFERGPWAFFQGVKKLVRASFVEASPGQELAIAASSRISERVSVLADLRDRLATVTGQVRCFQICGMLSGISIEVGFSVTHVPNVFHSGFTPGATILPDSCCMKAWVKGWVLGRW